MTPFITGRGLPGRDAFLSFFENRDSSFQDPSKAYPVTRPKDRSQQFRYDWMSYAKFKNTLPETNSKSTWKWTVGVRSFPCGSWPIFRGDLLFSGRVFSWCSKLASNHPKDSSKCHENMQAGHNGPNIFIWSNYSDLTRPHPKWWFSKGNPLISGKSGWVKYYNLAIDGTSARKELCSHKTPRYHATVDGFGNLTKHLFYIRKPTRVSMEVIVTF